MRSRTASEVLLDASTLCTFARHGLLRELRAHLGDRARITREVERELLRLAGRPEFAQLGDFRGATRVADARRRAASPIVRSGVAKVAHTGITSAANGVVD